MSEPYFLNPLVWLWRFRHRRGFGVHSPFAFSFLTDVVYETGQFYAYKELDELLPLCVSLLGLRPRKRLRLLFRLANFQHPKNAVFIGENALSFEAMKQAVPTANWKAELPTFLTEQAEHSAVQETSLQPVDLLYTDRPTLAMLGALHADSMLIVDDLRGNRSFWKALKTDERVALTFDLWDLGIVFFDKQYSRMDYTVCF